MKKYILLMLIICFYEKLYCQSDSYKKIIQSNIHYYWTTSLNEKEQKTYAPILVSLDYTLHKLFDEIKNDSIYSNNYNIFFLSGTNCLGNIVWSELWLNKDFQFNSVYIDENESRQVTRDFPKPLINFKQDIENWDEDFINRSTHITYINDASVFIAFSGKFDTNSNYSIKVKAFIDY